MNTLTIVVFVIFGLLVALTFFLNYKRSRRKHYGSSFDFSKMPNRPIVKKNDGAR